MSICSYPGPLTLGKELICNLNYPFKFEVKINLQFFSLKRNE